MNDVHIRIFEAQLEIQKKEILAAFEKMIEPFAEQGRRALKEFLEGEIRLKDEIFSRN